MKLYHGTTGAIARRALADGLRPRAETRRSNWAHSSPSHPRGVYLTDAYPLYLAVHSLDRAAAVANDHERMVAGVIEVESDRLNPFALAPDEDMLEQAGRGRDDFPEKWTMRQRTIRYRNRLNDYRDGSAWKKSLEAMGTCAHLGAIPPEAITRVALVHVKDRPDVAWAAMQAQISLAGYRFCRMKYRALTAVVLGDPPPEPETDLDRVMMGDVPTLPDRAGITIIAGRAL